MAQERTPPFSRIGVGVKISTLGAGLEAATPITSRSNARIGFNAFNYSAHARSDGIAYRGELSLRSLSVFYDQYLWGPLHVSPGLLLYNGNRGIADASVPRGQSFTLGGTNFVSNPANPVSGKATLDFGNKVAPAIMVGIGNLLPRNRHWGVNFDVGVVFQGSPKVNLGLNGGACYLSVCAEIPSNPILQEQIRLQQEKLNGDLSEFRYYPIVSIGVGFSF